MKRELDNEAHLEDSKKGRLENGLDNPHMVNNMQQQFLHQQHQYLQHQLQQLQQQQLQQQHPPEHHWTMQGQCAPRPALPAHMLPYAMQSYLQGPYTQPAPTPTPSIPRHHNEFLSYPSPYQNDPNALQLVQNPYMLQQQTVDGQKFVNFPDHTPSPSPSPNPPPLSPDVGETSPSPSPNPPLSPNIGEVQAPEVSNAAYYNPTVAMPIEHSKQVVDYSMACVQSVTPVEYPSPAQSPIPPVEHPTSVIITNSKGIPQSIPQSPLPTVEHPAAAVKSKSKGIPQVINNYTEHHPLELIDASMRRPNSENIYSSKDLPQIRTPYAEIPFAVSISSAGGVYSSSRVDIASDLSSSTTTMEVPFVNVTEATTPSKGSLAYGYSHQSSVHGHFKELDTNPEVIDSSHSAPHSPAGIPNPLSPYTSRLPNPPPNSPMVPHEYPTSDSQSINNDRYLASHSGFSSDNISKVHHYYSGVKTSISHDAISKSSPVTEKSLVEHAVNISEKISNLIEDPKKINLISASPQHRSSFIAVNSPVVQRNDVQNNSFDSSNNNGYIGAFSALIKSEEREQSNYGANLEREMYEKCEDQLNHQKFMKNQEGDAEEGNQEERRMQNKSDYGKYCTEEKKKDDAKKKEERKPFSFSPYLYQYLDSKQREVGIETIEWSSQLCTPPESPSATNSSTPASSPTDTAPVPLITLTPCTTYSCVSTEYFSNSAMSELRDDQGALCQGVDILMRNANGSLRLVGSPVKFDNTAITGAEVSPNHRLDSSLSLTHLPMSAASSPGSDILGDIMTQVGLVGIVAEDDMCLDENVIGIMEQKGPSPSFIGEAQEMGYYQQRQFECHLCQSVFHDAWNLQVHMVSHPTPTPRPKRRSLSSITSIETSPSGFYTAREHHDSLEFIPPHLTPSVRKGAKFRRGGRRTGNKENTSPKRNLIGKFPCPECNLDYTSQGHMKRHLESHGANRKYACDMCTASYSRTDTLEKHRDQHFLQNHQ